MSICAPESSMLLSLIFGSCAGLHRRISRYMGKDLGSGITLRAVICLSGNSNGDGEFDEEPVAKKWYHSLGTETPRRPVSLSVPTVAMAVFLRLGSCFSLDSFTYESVQDLGAMTRCLPICCCQGVHETLSRRYQSEFPQFAVLVHLRAAKSPFVSGSDVQLAKQNQS